MKLTILLDRITRFINNRNIAFFILYNAIGNAEYEKIYNNNFIQLYLRFVIDFK